MSDQGGPKQQTDPPSIPIIDLFPNAEGLEGEIQEYPLPKDGYYTSRYMFMFMYILVASPSWEAIAW